MLSLFILFIRRFYWQRVSVVVMTYEIHTYQRAMAHIAHVHLTQFLFTLPTLLTTLANIPNSEITLSTLLVIRILDV